MDHAVPIDETAVHRELEELAGGTPSTPGALPPGGPPGPPPIDGEQTVELSPEQIMAIAERNAPGMVLLFTQIGETFAPNWALQDEEIRRLSNATAIAMAGWLPSGVIPFKWMALLNLGGELVSIVKARRDPETGELRPLRAAEGDDGQGELEFGGAHSHDRPPS